MSSIFFYFFYLFTNLLGLSIFFCWAQPPYYKLKVSMQLSSPCYVCRHTSAPQTVWASSKHCDVCSITRPDSVEQTQPGNCAPWKGQTQQKGLCWWIMYNNTHIWTWNNTKPQQIAEPMRAGITGWSDSRLELNQWKNVLQGKILPKQRLVVILCSSVRTNKAPSLFFLIFIFSLLLNKVLSTSSVFEKDVLRLPQYQWHPEKCSSGSSNYLPELNFSLFLVSGKYYIQHFIIVKMGFIENLLPLL